MYRDAECLYWALSHEFEGQIEIFYADNLRKIEPSDKSSLNRDLCQKTTELVFGQWLKELDAIYLLEVINPLVLDFVDETAKIFYVPNLEWAIIDAGDQDVKAWKKFLKTYERRITVIAKTQKISEVLTKNSVSNVLIDWSIPDDIIKTKPSPLRFLRNIFSKKKIILMNAGTGGWKSRRGVDVMLEAARKISKNRNYHFILKTIKPWEDYQLEGIPENVELIEGFQNREELNLLVDSADMVIYPSRFEGFGLSLLETLHRGKPVMCTDGWPMSELQTIDDERLKISILKYTELRLAISYEPSSDSIVSNLEKLSNKNLSREFSQKMVVSGLKERQELFVNRICSMLTN